MTGHYALLVCRLLGLVWMVGNSLMLDAAERVFYGRPPCPRGCCILESSLTMGSR